MPSRTVANKLFTHQSVTKTTPFARYNIYMPHFVLSFKCGLLPSDSSTQTAPLRRFVDLVVRFTIGPLTSPIMYTAVVFLAGHLLTCGDAESNPGPGPGERQDYPWYQPPTRHGITTDIITRQAACSAGERFANQTRQTRHHHCQRFGTQRCTHMNGSILHPTAVT